LKDGNLKIPYPHQEEAIQALFDYFAEHSGSPVGVAPVAAGKSLIMAEFIKRACLKYPGTNFLVLSHVSKLLTQNEAELRGQRPEAHTSFYSDQLGSKRLDGQIIFAGIQSIHNKVREIPHKIDLVLIDECHLVSPSGNTMYRKFIAELKRANPKLKVIGVSGSPYRAGQGYIHQGEDRLFTDIAFNIPMTRLLKEGFLCPLVTPPMRTKMDTSKVAQQGGDFIASQLQDAVDVDSTTRDCVDEIIYHGVNRRKWIIFTTGKRHAQHVSDELTRRGISNAVVDGDTGGPERDLIYHQYQIGDLRCLVNVYCLTTGINFPAIDLIAMMCPTRSPVKYTQTGGRGMRLYPGKTDCLYLDFGGIIDALGPIDKVRVKEPRLKKGEAPTKVCPDCLKLYYSGVKKCPCGYEWPVCSTPNLTSTASDQAVLSTQAEAVWVDVTRWSFAPHEKVGKPVCMQVSYNSTINSQREWVHFNHSGWPRDKAVKWWAIHGGQIPPPATTMGAIARQAELTMPKQIAVKKTGKYTEIVGRKL
jgi:DNA repair protein RadD